MRNVQTLFSVRSLVLVAAGLVAVGGTASAKEACVKYEPEIVTLGRRHDDADLSRATQLIIPDYKSVRPLLGRKVRIIGTLMHAITGHHHTKVLIDASMIEAAR